MPRIEQNKLDFHKSFFVSLHHPVSTWRPRQDRGLTTSPRTVEKRYQDIRRQTIGATRHPGGTHSLCETRYATPGYIHWERLHLYMAGSLTDRPKFTKILKIISSCVNQLISWMCRERAGQASKTEHELFCLRGQSQASGVIHRFMNSFITHQ